MWENTLVQVIWNYESWLFAFKAGPITTTGLILHYFMKISCIWFKKRNIMVSESIITVTEDANSGKNTHFNKMANKKYNQLMKTYKMAVSIKLKYAAFPPLLNCTVAGLFLLVPPRFHVLLHQGLFSKKLMLFHLNLLLKLVINLFLGPLVFSWKLCS